MHGCSVLPRSFILPVWTYQRPLQLEDGSLPDIPVNLCTPCSPCSHAILSDPWLFLNSLNSF